MKKIFLIIVLLLVATALCASPVAVLAVSKADNILPLAPADQQLPAEDFETQIVPNIIKIFLSLVGTIIFGVFVYAGVMLVLAQGNEEEITKFKNLLIWSLVGTAFIVASYAIVSGAMQLVFE